MGSTFTVLNIETGRGLKTTFQSKLKKELKHLLYSMGFEEVDAESEGTVHLAIGPVTDKPWITVWPSISILEHLEALTKSLSLKLKKKVVYHLIYDSDTFMAQAFDKGNSVFMSQFESEEELENLLNTQGIPINASFKPYDLVVEDTSIITQLTLLHFRKISLPQKGPTKFDFGGIEGLNFSMQNTGFAYSLEDQELNKITVSILNRGSASVGFQVALCGTALDENLVEPLTISVEDEQYSFQKVTDEEGHIHYLALLENFPIPNGYTPNVASLFTSEDMIRSMAQSEFKTILEIKKTSQGTGTLFLYFAPCSNEQLGQWGIKIMV